MKETLKDPKAIDTEQEKIYKYFDISEWVWVVPTKPVALKLVDPSTRYKPNPEIKRREWFYVAWKRWEAEEKIPKLVPNNVTFGSFIKNETLKVVNPPKQKLKE